jgi:hypothetical protein
MRKISSYKEKTVYFLCCGKCKILNSKLQKKTCSYSCVFVFHIWDVSSPSGKRYSCLIFSFIHQWLYSPLLGPGLCFSFVILYTVGRTPWTGDQPVTRPLPTHRTVQTKNKRTQTSNASSGIRTHVPSVRADEDSSCLSGGATVIRFSNILRTLISFLSENSEISLRTCHAHRFTVSYLLVCFLFRVKFWILWSHVK